MPKNPKQKRSFLLPWVAGSGIAATQILLNSGCSVPQTGKCAACGGCVVAIVGLVGWAYLGKKKPGWENAA